MAAEEVVTRIVIQDEGGDTGPAAQGQVPQTHPTPPQTTPAQQQATQAATAGANPPWLNTLVEGIAGANRHVLIEGQSGSGKSMLTRHVAFERMRQGEDVHVVDPHTPELWKGAKQVFGREAAASDAADFLRNTLRGREQERNEAKARGEDIDFKPLTVVMSDFARLLKDAPELGKELRTLLTEARKFNVAIVADTTALTGAETGLKGILNIRKNFAQKVEMFAPSSDDPERTARVGGQRHTAPLLPDYADRFDPSIIREASPPPPPPPPEPFDPMREAEKRREGERRGALVRQAYKERFGEDDGKGTLDRVMDVAGKFRGVIGGFAGSLIGAGLDALSQFRDAQSNVRDRRLIGEISPPAEQAPEIPPSSTQAPTSPVAASDPGKALSPANTAVNPSTGRTAAATGTSGAAGGAASMAKSLAIAAGAAAAFAIAVKLVADAMSSTAERLAGYNADIAAASARADIRRTQGDIRRGREAAPVLTEFTDARSRLAERAEDLKIKFMEAVGPIVTEILNGVNILVQIVTTLLEVVQGIFNFVGDLPIIGDILGALGGIWKFLKDTFSVSSDEETSVTPADIIARDMFRHLPQVAPTLY